MKLWNSSLNLRIFLTNILNSSKYFIFVWNNQGRKKESFEWVTRDSWKLVRTISDWLLSIIRVWSLMKILNLMKLSTINCRTQGVHFVYAFSYFLLINALLHHSVVRDAESVFAFDERKMPSVIFPTSKLNYQMTIQSTPQLQPLRRALLGKLIRICTLLHHP